MRDSQKLGGLAALYAAAAYVFGLLGYGLVVDYGSAADPAEKVALLADNQDFLYLLTLLVFVAFAPVLVVLALALYERLKAGARSVMQVATALGLIWAGLIIGSGMVFMVGMGNVVDASATDPAQAATAWLAVESVFDGLGGGNEIVGGLWVLLVSWAGLRSGRLPKALNYYGVLVGVAGILSTVPALAELGQIAFGLGQIPWFVGLGIVMLRRSPSAAL